MNRFSFLNKEFSFNVKGFPIGKLLSALSNSIVFSILISYLIYNIIIFINPVEYQLSFLKLPKTYSDGNLISIFQDQSLILSQYYAFMADAIQLDFGKFGNTDRFIKINNAFQNTLLFLVSALIFSFLFSCMLLIVRRVKNIENTIVKFLCNISLLHVSIIFIIVNEYVVNFTNHDFSLFWKIMFCSVVISFGSGMLLDFYNLIKEEFDSIMQKDYVLFAKDSGFSPYLFALKELSFNLISISISRIPLIFGGLVVIEHKMREDGLDGISTFIFRSLDSGDDISIFSSVFICIIFFTTIFFLSEKLKESLIQK